MKFLFDKEKLNELLINFYNLTGIRLVIFDSEFVRVAAYPEADCEFCRAIRKNNEGNKLCVISDNEAFKSSKDGDFLHIYKCHAGLAEAVFPLKMNDIVIGYIMFGQILDKADKKADKYKFIKYLSTYCDDTEECERIFSKLVSKSDTQIKAAAKIMESCACYLCVRELVKIYDDGIIFRLDSYINNNITDDLSVSALCTRFNLSKNKLYEISQSIYGMGIATYVRKKRVDIAKKCLNDGMTVAEAAEKSGFYDYNYFSKIFKRETGIVPSKFI